MPSSPPRGLSALVIAFAVVWHLLSVLTPPRVAPPKDTAGRDYASYHYAWRVARAGGDPYDLEALNRAAQDDGARSWVHPYFYPPPFLIAVGWSGSLSLSAAFTVWFWLNELALALALFALWRWWRPLGDGVAACLAIAVAVSHAVAYSQELGQANFGVFAAIAVALWQQARRPALAGVALGTACMWKMSPALLVFWWLAQRRWQAAGSAALTGLAWTLLSLAWVAPADQLAFYTEVLPRFGSGDYNGLKIQIGMFANHSLPNLLDQIWPGVDNRLSSTARGVGGALALALVGAQLVAFRQRTDDPLAAGAQASAVMITMLLVPVYTYEHHLVFALPALVITTIAVARGALGPAVAPALGLVWALIAADVPAMRQWVIKSLGEASWAGFVVQEAKFAALWILLLTATWLGSRRPTSP